MFCATTQTRAATYWFRGGTNGSLATLGNWATDASGTASDVAPSASDDVVFSVTSSNSIAINRWSMANANRTYASITLSNSGSNYILRTGDAGATNTSTVNLTLSAGITNASTAGAFLLGDTDRRVLLRIAAGAGDFVIANNSASAVTFLDSVSLQTANTTNRTLRVDGTGAGSVFFSGGIENGGGSGAALSLRISNTGAVSIAGSSYTGGTILDAGTLALAAGSALGTGTLVINGGAIGSVTSARTIANAIVVGGNFSLGVTNAGFSGQSTTFNGDVNLGNATRTITLIANSATFGGIISNGGLILNSTSSTRTLTLTNAATYTGGTTIAGGELAVTASGSLASGGAVNVSASTTGATLTLSGITASSLEIASLAGGASGTVALGTKNLLISGNGASNNYAGTITGTGGSLTKSGTGTLVLSSANTFSGGVTLSAGTLGVGNSGAPWAVAR